MVLLSLTDCDMSVIDEVDSSMEQSVKNFASKESEKMKLSAALADINVQEEEVKKVKLIDRPPLKPVGSSAGTAKNNFKKKGPTTSNPNVDSEVL